MVDFFRKSTRSVGGLFIAQSHQKYNFACFNRTMKAILELVSSFLQPFSWVVNPLLASNSEFDSLKFLWNFHKFNGFKNG